VVRLGNFTETDPEVSTSLEVRDETSSLPVTTQETETVEEPSSFVH
jgi:hypothetical protein